MPIEARRTAAGLLVLAAALMTGSCAPHPKAAYQPNGTVMPLRTGYWAGPMGTNRVDFHVERVMADRVAIRISGSKLDPNAHNQPGDPVTFSDRPTTCKINAGNTSFDCLRYKDMHIDNGFLCGTYGLYGQVYNPCFAPMDAVKNP
jgi:hypothetical protein